MQKYLVTVILIVCIGCNYSNQSEKNKINTVEFKDSNDYFTIGSTEEEVLKVMGEPDSYQKKHHGLEVIIGYGRSKITIQHGHVIGYNNSDKNLKVKLIK